MILRSRPLILLAIWHQESNLKRLATYCSHNHLSAVRILELKMKMPVLYPVSVPHLVSSLVGLPKIQPRSISAHSDWTEWGVFLHESKLDCFSPNDWTVDPV
ncbi:hypothetical protein RvY_16661 [Ramazzottius varieornatus]|uniref:Uncharacterized protein n=1 Tax=Ramazzottius varieornatus TaxID=947166 RepID=A0A1D1VZA9_RAMVA|nr:hypothetical protein RvY_16661 [Ramazzottius varieornatus]